MDWKDKESVIINRASFDGEHRAWMREHIQCSSCKWWEVYRDTDGAEEWGDCTETTVSMEYAGGDGFHTSRHFGCVNHEPKEAMP